MVPDTNIGRKLPHEYENPLDNIVMYIAEVLNVYMFHPLSFTPNMITTLSLMTGLASCYFLYISAYTSSAILFVLAYILDCADGNYARRYNMVSSFGDIYDHVSDIIKCVAILVVILLKPLSILQRITIIALGIILYTLTLFHLACQEKVYDKPDGNEFLASMTQLCTSKDNIIFTRYFGCGTFILYITIIILLLPFMLGKLPS